MATQSSYFFPHPCLCDRSSARPLWLGLGPTPPTPIPLAHRSTHATPRAPCSTHHAPTPHLTPCAPQSTAHTPRSSPHRHRPRRRPAVPGRASCHAPIRRRTVHRWARQTHRLRACARPSTRL
eukprot:358436-Chlamydomonas_euryale.AAC.1